MFTSEIKSGTINVNSFIYLGETYTITDSTNPYDIMSNMIIHTMMSGKHINIENTYMKER